MRQVVEGRRPKQHRTSGEFAEVFQPIYFVDRNCHNPFCVCILSPRLLDDCSIVLHVGGLQVCRRVQHKTRRPTQPNELQIG
jgi:hypothetical protein